MHIALRRTIVTLLAQCCMFSVCNGALCSTCFGLCCFPAANIVSGFPVRGKHTQESPFKYVRKLSQFNYRPCPEDYFYYSIIVVMLFLFMFWAGILLAIVVKHIVSSLKTKFSC